MTKRLVRTAILIGFVVIIIVLNICVNSTRQEDENTLDIEKIYIFREFDTKEIYPTDAEFEELSKGINSFLAELSDNIFSGVDGRISLDGSDSNIARKNECHIKILFSTPVVIKDNRRKTYDVSMLYFEGDEILFIFSGDYKNTLEAVNGFGIKKSLSDYVEL